MAEVSMKAPTAGIDVGKAWLDVAVLGVKEQKRFQNDDAGFIGLIEWLQAHGVVRVGLEATGGYEQAVAAALRAAGFAVLLLQPVQVRAFAKFRLQRAKNDQIDARLIAECADAATMRDTVHDERLAQLANRLTFIEQIEEDIARCKTRREACRDERILALLAQELARLKTLRRNELAGLFEKIAAHCDLKQRLLLIESIPGLGRRTAIALVIRMPELGRASREQAAALVGAAPFDDRSGKRDGQKHIAGGRERARKSLYAAALPAAFRWNKALVDLYGRLVSAGKPHKVALIACVRKLIIYANAVLARGTPWQMRDADI